MVFFFIKGKRILGILISIILFTQQLMPVSIANAEGGVSTNKDVTDSIQFLEDVKLLEPSEGSTIGEDLTKKENIDINSKVSILYSFRMPERDESNLDNNINEEDFAYIDIPEEINMSDITLPITTKESENIVNIGTLTYDSNIKKLKVTFTDFNSKYHNVYGTFQFTTWFLADKLGDGGEKDINFKLSKDKITTIHLKFNPIERQKPTIKKEVGNYNSADNTIDWKITLDCKDNKELKDVTIEDELENGHELVSDSVKVYNGSEKPANEVTNGILIPSSSGFKYKFADNISGIKVSTLKTKVSPDLLKSNEADKKVKNTSILYLKDKEIQRSSAEKPINIKWIEKSGKYDGATKKITWTIKLYNNGITDDSNKILLTDTMDSKVKLDIDSVEINGEEDLEVNNVNTTLSKLEISGHLNKNTIIQYTTSVADESIFYGNKVTKVNNTAYLSGDLIPENTKGEAPGVGITSTVIKKSGEVKPSLQSIKFDDDEVDDTEFTYEDNVLIFDFSNKFDVEESDEGYFNKKHTITYTTKIKNFYSYLTEEKKSGSEFNNSVEFKSKEVDSCTVDASAKYLPNIIAKKGSYDYKSNQVNWEITVNSDKVDLDKLEITDTIPEGQEYVKGSLNTKEQDYNPETRTITCDFSKEKKKTKIVKFSTKITDENFFKLNSSDGTKQLETKKVYNEVQLTSNKITGSVLSKGGCAVNISPILKVAEYKNNSNVIKWSIIVNRNCINMGNITVVDDLDPNLTLDTSSIKVYKVPSKSELITNTSLSVEEKVKCSIELPIENFSFPDNKIEVALSDVKESYIVQFETIIDPALSDNKSVSNTAYLEGSTVKEAGREVVENIRFMSGSAIGTGENGKITVLNVDPDEGDKPLKEAEFELYDRFKRKVGETKTTDEDGKVVFEGLKFGVTYTVKEIKAPAGYKIDSENSSWDFKIEENDTVKEKSYTFENKKVNGNIKITKAEFNNELNKLPGALFAVYKDNGDNVFNEVDDTNVFPDILSTGNDGVCLIKDVPYGVYWIKEILAPDSYEIDSTPQRVEVKEEGKTYEVGNYSGKIFFNKPIEVDVELTKVDKEDDTHKPLPGAVFVVYKADKNGKYSESDKAGELKDEDNDGIYTGKFRYGDYVLVEETAPEGYEKSSESYKFNINSKGKYIIKNDGNYFTNNKIKGNISITKVEEGNTSKKLSGAEFTIYKDNGNDEFNITDDIEIGKMTDLSDGSYEYKDLEYGTYWVKETKAPAGYKVSTKKSHSNGAYKVVIDKNKETKIVSNTDDDLFEDTLIKGTVKIVKVDAENTDKKLSGAIFKVYKKTDSGEEFKLQRIIIWKISIKRKGCTNRFYIR